MVINATIYLNNITSGHPIAGVFNMYDAVFGGYMLFILFIVFRTLLLIKNKNALLGWVVTIIFLGIYVTMYSNTAYFTHSGLAIIFFILVFESGSTLYSIFIK